MKKFIRKIVYAREKETIRDAISRHYVHFLKHVSRSEHKISKDELKFELQNMGISRGDILMVHVSWRHFYNFQGTPEELIDLILEIIGKEGTLLMPSFGNDLTFFDVKNTKSNAGVVSEIFRNMKGVMRSESSHFSVSGIGPSANKILKKHKYSEFGFDLFSPYYLFSQEKKAKVLNLGMGKYPIKTSLIHCMEYLYKDVFPYFKKYLIIEYDAIVIDQNGEKNHRKMIKGTYARLNRRNIVKFYKALPKNNTEYKKIGKISVRLFDANVAFEVLKKLTVLGYPMLKPPYKEKNSFKRIEKN